MLYPFSFLGTALSPQALAWKANIEANGGTIPANTLAIVDANLITPLVNSGDFALLDRLNLFAGLVGFEIAARTNIIKAAHYVTPVSSPTFDNNGYASAGTSYLDLNYNAFTQGVNYTLNNAIHGYMVKNPPYSAQRRAMGAVNGATTQRNDVQRNTIGNDGFINSGASISDTNKPTGNVFIAVKRTASNACALIVNSTTTSSTAASTAIPNFNMFELCLNLAGTPTGPFDTAPHMTSFCGGGGVNEAFLRTCLNNTFTALGV